MNDRELELIAALADGSLEDETEARALIAASSEARAEYEAQLAALAALEAVTPTTMTEAERAGLRRDVWTELRSPAAPSTSRAPWYYRWAPIAASLFVLIGLVAILDQGNNNEAFQVAAETSALPDEGGGADMEDGAGVPAAPPSDSIPTEAGPFASYYSAVAEDLRADEGELAYDAVESLSRHSVTEECLAQTGLTGYSVIGSHQIDEAFGEGSVPPVEFAIIAIRTQDDLTSSPIAFIDPDSCEILHFDE